MYNFSRNPENIFEDFAYRIFLDNYNYLNSGNYDLKNFLELISEKPSNFKEKIDLVMNYISVFSSALMQSELEDDEKDALQKSYDSLLYDIKSLSKIERSYQHMNKSLDAIVKMFDEALNDVNQKLYFFVDFSLKHFSYFSDLECFLKTRKDEIMKLIEDTLKRKNKKILGSLSSSIRELNFLKENLLKKYNLEKFWFEEEILKKYSLSLEYILSKIEKIKIPANKVKKLTEKFGLEGKKIYENIILEIHKNFNEFLENYKFWLEYYKSS
ncbi:MAG: hypothetical protein QXR30_02500 [Candidatus Woesearchaeota archaeon]